MPPSSRHVSQPLGTALPASQPQADNLSVVLATGGYDNTIRFWEAWSGMCSRVINHGGSQVNKLAISPDKRFLAAAGNSSVRIFDVATAGLGGSAHHSPVRVATFEGHTGNVTCLIWNGDGKWLASGGEDGTIKVWDIRSASVQRNYTHTASVNDLQLQSHQGELISCDQSGAIKIWDLSSSVCTHEFEDGVPMRSVSVASDSTLLVGGNNKGNVFVWSLLHSLSSTDLRPKYKFNAHSKYLLKCSISPDTKYLATSSADATINIYSTGSQGPHVKDIEFRFEKTLTGHQRWVWDLAWSADSAYLVSSSSDHTARLWELSTGMTVRQYAGHHKPCVTVALNDISTEEEQVQMMNAVKM
ncbi:WD40 repeat-like protein [Atractiella rhizophila]|nr:WD40 repeat-like protein [Atractiella rhizophila]